MLDFSGLTDGTEVQWPVFDGVPFQVTKNGSPTNGIVAIDGGPGITGHVSPPNLVSISDLDGVALVISLPNLATKFGDGYALRSENTVPAATTINLFAGITPIGSITFTGTPDPLFTGGFAGVASDSRHPWRIGRIPALMRISPSLGFSFRILWQMIRNPVPGRAGFDEGMKLRANAGIIVECSHADRDLIALGPVTTEQA